MRKQLFWLIQGHDGTKCFFAKTVAIGQFTDDQVRDLLRAMTAKASLSYPEMMEAYASRRTKAYAARLDVHKDPDLPDVHVRIESTFHGKHRTWRGNSS